MLRYAPSPYRLTYERPALNSAPDCGPFCCLIHARMPVVNSRAVLAIGTGGRRDGQRLRRSMIRLGFVEPVNRRRARALPAGSSIWL